MATFYERLCGWRAGQETLTGVWDGTGGSTHECIEQAADALGLDVEELFVESDADGPTSGHEMVLKVRALSGLVAKMAERIRELEAKH